MPKKRTLDLTEEQRDALLHHRDHDKRPYVRERCAALLKVAQGMSARQVALRGLLKRRCPETVRNWLNIYEAEGIFSIIRGGEGESLTPDY